MLMSLPWAALFPARFSFQGSAPKPLPPLSSSRNEPAPRTPTALIADYSSVCPRYHQTVNPWRRETGSHCCSPTPQHLARGKEHRRSPGNSHCMAGGSRIGRQPLALCPPSVPQSQESTPLRVRIRSVGKDLGMGWDMIESGALVLVSFKCVPP